jgi:hypothetical protein
MLKRNYQDIKMSRLSKAGLVLGGYVLACLIAIGAVYAYEWSIPAAASQASSGMYAFGDLILFISVCGFLALFPTGLAVFFLIRKFLARPG